MKRGDANNWKRRKQWTITLASKWWIFIGCFQSMRRLALVFQKFIVTIENDVTKRKLTAIAQMDIPPKWMNPWVSKLLRLQIILMLNHIFVTWHSVFNPCYLGMHYLSPVPKHSISTTCIQQCSIFNPCHRGNHINTKIGIKRGNSHCKNRGLQIKGTEKSTRKFNRYVSTLTQAFLNQKILCLWDDAWYIFLIFLIFTSQNAI